MVRPEIIRKRLNKLDDYLEILRSLQKYDRDAFLSNPERYGSAERFLHLAIEALLDMGNHVIADEGIGIVDWYSDIPKLLSKKGILTSEMCDKFIRMIGFRNTLVHEYTDIDRSIVYNVLKDGLEDLVILKRIFAGFL